MGFFTKTTDNDKWKENYLNLLDEQEQVVNAYKEKEELLCKTIVRLSIATAGLDPLLDPYLQRIRDHLKKGIDNHTLKTELENFTSAVVQMKQTASQIQPIDASLLFDFLFRQYTTETQQSSLHQLKETSEQNKFATPDQLFTAILEAIEAEYVDNTTSAPIKITNYIDTSTVSKQLLLLLEGIEIPGTLDHQAKTVKQLLATSSQLSTAFAFESVLDKSVNLLLKIKQHSQSERQDINKFLSHITEQLAALGQTVNGASTAAQKSAENRNKLDQSVSEQMKELQLSSTHATKLEPLKEVISNRLATITKEIQEHTHKEATQRQKTQQQLDELTVKIKDIESESSDLKSKLKIANTQALRDTLTGLPNRNAYNERMKSELARWKRYHAPLSLLVWDIDHFKKINDSYGHKAGDKVLQLIAKQLSEHSRETDFISRFGGEEFTMLLPNTNKQSALILANKLRQTIEKTGFNASGSSVAITVSCGLTEFIEGDTDEIAFDRADQALYEAKEKGRNQCCIS